MKSPPSPHLIATRFSSSSVASAATNQSRLSTKSQRRPLNECRQLRRFVPPVPAPPPPPQENEQNPSLNPTHSQHDFFTLSNLLSDPNVRSVSSLESALDRTGIQPEPSLLQAVFDHFDSSPKLLHTLFLWAGKKPGFQSSATLFNSMINALGKAREFDSAWCLLLDRMKIDGDERPGAFVSADTFAILIRRYSRAGMPGAAIRTFEYAGNLNQWECASDAAKSLLEILLDSLCKEGHVRVAREYFDRIGKLDPCWVPSVRMYNILLNGWFRSRKLKHAERLWLEMKEKKVAPNVVTYGTMVEGYCRMRRVEMAIDLVQDMRKERIEPNAIVYNPIIDALAEAGRFKEASAELERFLLYESGPTISTYNSLVKGYCKAGDLEGASNILKMMIGRGFFPTTTTYNYFFKHFAKFGNIEEGMNLYTKMIESGYKPDRHTYHLLLKLLCGDGRLELAVEVSKEMKARGYDIDLAASTMLIHLLCKMHRFEEAFERFEEMLQRGIRPQYLTFHRLNDELRKQGMTKMADKLCNLMSSVPHSTKLPNTYNVDSDKSRHARRALILQKAEAMSEVLKISKNPKRIARLRKSSQNPVSSANMLLGEISRKVRET